MRLNNKGFAISTILYGMLLLGSLLLFLLIGLQNFQHNSTTDFNDSIAKELNRCVNLGTC